MPSSTRDREESGGGKRPSDVPTGETLAFVQAAGAAAAGAHPGSRMRRRSPGHSPPAAGLRSGRSRRRRGSRGSRRKRGLDARRADWPSFSDRPFDVVLFTRSLHHIPALTAAVARAKELLNPNGRVLVEDFARHAIQPLAAEWLFEMLAVLHAADLLARDPEGLLDRMLQYRDAMEAWRAAHDHDLHSAETMPAALEALLSGGRSGDFPLSLSLCVRAPRGERAGISDCGADPGARAAFRRGRSGAPHRQALRRQALTPPRHGVRTSFNACTLPRRFDPRDVDARRHRPSRLIAAVPAREPRPRAHDPSTSLATLRPAASYTPKCTVAAAGRSTRSPLIVAPVAARAGVALMPPARMAHRAIDHEHDD